ncbi:uncharacterized protein LOC142624725 [Castanea sativa]|uniref:uncharacterized protein LOC142624725 n=1 Tax=Castanea sativa TaxID=21020 RepID=UPI003F651748
MGESVIKYHNIRAKAEVFLLDFKSAHGQVQRVSIVGSRAVRWMPPISPLYKLNFDGALFRDQGDAGLGVVIRDSSGQVVGALAERIPIPKSAATVEARAYRRALLSAKELSIYEIVCEGDAEVIVRALMAKEVENPKYGHVLQDILFLASDFRFC